jgi:L-aspartate oxidase
MWEEVGLVRTEGGLRAALARLGAIEGSHPHGPTPLGSLVTVARLVATAALERTESRGAHYRADHPLADPAWRRRLLLTRDGDGVRCETRAAAPGSPAADPVEVCA